MSLYERSIMKRTKLDDRILPNYSKGEEIANMVTHIVGGTLGIVSLVLCVIFSSIKGNVYGIIGSSIFGIMMIFLYTMSSIYHGLNRNLKAKKVFQIIDHCTIFLLISGTYTPILLCSVREYNSILGWSLFAFIWVCAIIGIILNAIDLKRYKIFSLICYLGMGWSIIVLGKNFINIVGIKAAIFLLIGGLLYTIGFIFYAFGKKVRYFRCRFIWSLGTMNTSMEYI